MASKPTHYVVTAALAGDGVEYHLGEVVEADDPAIKKWPAHFGPLIVREHYGAKKATPVEQATAAPGEKRTVEAPPEPEPEPPQGKAMTVAAMKGR
jgi:hypothetical protein